MGLFERYLTINMGDDAPITAANPQGINAYDKGKSFEEATGGVERDANGRFAPEDGSHSGRFRGGSSSGRFGRGDRAARRRASMARSRKAREEAEAKKSDSAEKKADKAKRDAQRKELASISLEIARAAAAGYTVKAAELRVKKAERVLAFADTDIERLSAQTTLTNALAALSRARRSSRRRTSN